VCNVSNILTHALIRIDLIQGKSVEVEVEGEGNLVDMDIPALTSAKIPIEEIAEIGMTVIVTVTGEIEIGTGIDTMLATVQTEARKIPTAVQGKEAITEEVQKEMVITAGRVGTRIDD